MYSRPQEKLEGPGVTSATHLRTPKIKKREFKLIYTPLSGCEKYLYGTTKESLQWPALPPMLLLPFACMLLPDAVELFIFDM